MNKILLLITILVCCSCHLKTNYKSPSADLPTDWASYSQTFGKDKQSKLNWWSRFNDAILNSLVNEALIRNSSILIAMSNVTKAQAQLAVNNSYKLPEIDLQGVAKQTKTNNKTSNSFAVSAVLNYEIDIWSAVANADKVARATLLSSDYTKKAVKLTVITNVINTYFTLAALDKKLAITKELIHLQEASYKLSQNLFLSGASDLITLNKAKSELAMSKATLSQIEQSKEEQDKALKILLCKTPKQIVNEKLAHAQFVEDELDHLTIPPILPSELLEQRPDIMVAEQNLIAADANVKIAKASYFPNISLTGLIQTSNSRLNNLFSDTANNSSFGVNITEPIINWGRTKATVKISEETRTQSIIQYQETIRIAFQEVMNSLSAHKASTEKLQLSYTNQQALQKILTGVTYRKTYGTATEFDLLNAKQDFLQARISTINAKLDKLIALTNLFHALGGDWDKTPNKNLKSQ